MKKKKWFITTIILVVIIVSGCGQKLTRDLAKKEIIEKKGYPLTIYMKLPVGVLQDPLQFATIETLNTKNQKVYNVAGFSTKNFDGENKYFSCMKNPDNKGWWNTNLTKEGEKVFINTSEKFGLGYLYKAEMCKVDIEITGITLDNGGKEAVVTYRRIPIQITPSGETLMSFSNISANENKIFMQNYGDGWRI